MKENVKACLQTSDLMDDVDYGDGGDPYFRACLVDWANFAFVGVLVTFLVDLSEKV